MRTKLLHIFLFFLCLSLVGGVIRSWVSVGQGKKVVKDAEDKLHTTQQEKENLERQLARSQSKEFIERQARGKLNLGKEGEIILIMPSISSPAEPTPTPNEHLANWEKWVRVFF